MLVADILTSIVAVLIVIAAFVAGYFVLLTRRIAADAERRVPPAGSFVTVDGNRLHYIEAGSGPPILMIHGLGGQSMQFRQTLFDDLARDFRVVALDRPGSGYSVRAAGATGRLPEQAAVVAQFIAALGLERPLVVGHSLGGAVALATALDHPLAIGGLALLAPLTHLPETVDPALKALHIRSATKRWIVAQTIAVPMALKYAGQTLSYIFAPQSAPRDYMIAGGGMIGLRPSHFYATSTDFVAIESDLGAMEARYGDIGLPVGMLFGTADHVLDHRVHALPIQAALPAMTLELVDGLGHMVPYGATDRTLALIRAMAEDIAR